MATVGFKGLNKKVWKPYNTADSWNVNFPQISGKECSMGTGIDGVSEFLQVIYTKPFGNLL